MSVRYIPLRISYRSKEIERDIQLQHVLLQSNEFSDRELSLNSNSIKSLQMIVSLIDTREDENMKSSNPERMFSLHIAHCLSV